MGARVQSKPFTSVSERKLIKAAAYLFAEKGFEGTSVRQIVERAGYTKPVLYYYFGSKEGLCQRMLRAGLVRLNEMIDEALHARESLRERLVELVWAHFRFCLENRDLTRFLYSLIFGPSQQIPHLDFTGFVRTSCDRLAELLRREARGGKFPRGYEEEASLFLLGIINIYVVHQMNQRKTVLSRQVAESAVDFLICGLAGLKNRRRRYASRKRKGH